ncbi:MAG: glycosyltransferase [Saprospiraceae bacterium]|nr:glycosyltransferase [Saprospiraceae bacterium]
MNNHNPLFSILIANYNNGRYIEEAIESVERQTYTNWEIIIIDDASTDNSLKILEKFQDNNKIKIHQNPRNLGCGGAKRAAVALANGDIAAFLDPDDIIAPEALEIMVGAHLKHPETSLVYSQIYSCDEQLNPQFLIKWVGPIPKGKSNLHVDNISQLATFKMDAYRKTDGIGSELLRAVDKELYYKLEEVGSVIFIEQPLYYYRIHNGGISTFENQIKAKRWAFYVKKQAFLRRLYRKTKAPNISFWRLQMDFLHLQYKALRSAILKRRFDQMVLPLKRLAYFPKKKILQYPPPE